jgi:hypothetical protein
MRVRDLIEVLGKVDPNLIVKAYDPDVEFYDEITGFEFDSYSVILQTDF